MYYLLIAVPIIAIILFAVYYFMRIENLTTMEAQQIMPILFDSSLPNKTKITDLLGIPVNDISYNSILGQTTNDPDTVIANVKTYLGSIVSFNTATPTTVQQTATAWTPPPTDTKPPATFKDRVNTMMEKPVE